MKDEKHNELSSARNLSSVHKVYSMLLRQTLNRAVPRMGGAVPGGTIRAVPRMGLPFVPILLGSIT